MEIIHQPRKIIAEKYQVIGALGQGGVAITYAASDLQSNQRVALKVLSLRRMTEWKKLELFEREARILAQLNHTSIPQYLNYFHIDTPIDRNFYIIQQLAPGKSLDVLVNQGWRPKEKRVINIAIQVLEILVYLQSFTPAIIHRDIKPQNIILQKNGKVFLVDFGAVQDTYHHTVTGGSTVVGTYGYMAPEQFRGQAVLSTDLYGLGTTLLFLLTGQVPADLPRRKFKIDFRDRVNISTELADWIEKAISPTIEERFRSAKEALAALRSEQIFTLNPDKVFRRSPVGRITLLDAREWLLADIKPMWLSSNKKGLIGLMNRISKILLPLSLIIQFFYFFDFLLSDGKFLGYYMADWLWAFINEVSFFIMNFSLNYIGLSSIIFLLWLVYYLVRATWCLRIEVDRDNFCMQWWLLGLCYQKIQERKANIKPIKLQKLGVKHLSSCVVPGKERQYRFGLFLSQKEKQWLVEELNNFLFTNST